MRVNSCLLVGVVVLAVVGIGFAAVPGPNDLRYPDYIVDPRVNCEEEGSFPHPRNCSWYYRCVDRMKTGFFFTYYFECEPGTVFSDALDQCVFPFLTNPPCGTNGTGPFPPTGPGPVPPPPPPGPIPETPLTPSPPSPPGTDPPSTGGETTGPVTGGGGGGGLVSCEYTDDTCESFSVCSPEEKTLTLCDGCYIGTLLIPNLCPSGQARDRDTNQCVPYPTQDQLCSDLPLTGPVIDIGTTNTIRCSAADLIPHESWIISEFCDTYAFCAEGGQYLHQAKLCDSYYNCSRQDDGSWVPEVETCGPDQLFTYDFPALGVQEECVPKPTAAELC